MLFNRRTILQSAIASLAFLWPLRSFAKSHSMRTIVTIRVFSQIPDLCWYSSDFGNVRKAMSSVSDPRRMITHLTLLLGSATITTRIGFHESGVEYHYNHYYGFTAQFVNVNPYFEAKHIEAVFKGCQVTLTRVTEPIRSKIDYSPKENYDAV